MTIETNDAVTEGQEYLEALLALIAHSHEGRLTLGLTHEALAEEVGLDPSIVCKLVKRKRFWMNAPQRAKVRAWHERRKRCLRRA